MKEGQTSLPPGQAGLFTLGALASALLSSLSFFLISVLWQSMPLLIYTAPDGTNMNLAREANHDHFYSLKGISTWVLWLGALFTGFCMASHRKLSLRALISSSLTTLFLTLSTILIAVSMWAVTHLQGGSWHLSGHNRIESYGNHPHAVVSYKLFFAAVIGWLHMMAFFAGLLWTNQNLKRVNRTEPQNAERHSG